MKTKTIFVGLLFALLGFQSHLLARLGETEDEIQKRYGAPVENRPEQLAHGSHDDMTRFFIEHASTNFKVSQYKYNNYTIIVVFLNGKSQYEEYNGLPDGPALGTVDKDAVQTLLDANSLGHTWTKLPDAHGLSHWGIQGVAAATLDAPGGLFVVISKEMYDYAMQMQKQLQDKAAQDKAKTLQGF